MGRAEAERATRGVAGQVQPMGWLEGAAHLYPVRVFYEDTDAAGIVYYANYLKFIERARTELMRLLGISHSAMKRESGLSFVVRRCAVDYGLPARLDDDLVVETRVRSVRGASIELDQDVTRAGETLISAALRLAVINEKGKAARLPGAVRAALVPLLQEEGGR